ncbi:hypothetical protein [Nocardioides massiliensis]|uniref:DUF4232 domain-containing protein n=1 Tax=Nocardioides massiliensis TaxID=1325935 RepID=A0ABT9NN17_9ACTN|nr:hypothetical protein [Nocardioides massiliensis]MDP9821642.1 hypothetical protein [Nocardioides massiliensis]
MPGIARPRGPLPARVYWTRRLLVLGVALALVLGVKTLLGQAPQDPGAPTARQVGGPASVELAEPTSTDDAAVEAGEAAEANGQQDKGKQGKQGKQGKGKKAKNTPPPLPEPKGVCLDPDVRVTPKVEGASAGGGVRIDLELTSSLSEACTWTVSPKTVVVKLTSGPDRIWTSQECPRTVPTQDVVVRRDTPAVVSMTWNGRRSNAECTGNTKWALPGYYHVLTAALGGQPTEVQFRLRRPSAPVITKTIKPKKPKTQAAKPQDEKPAQQKKKRQQAEGAAQD